MYHQVDRESVSVLSLREREQNRSLHHCSKNHRTGLEQIEQVAVSLKRFCSKTLEQINGKRPVSRAEFKTTCSKALEQIKSAIVPAKRGN
jgi:hypothetical protein